MEKISKISGVLRGNWCETCRNIPQKNTYEGVYQEEFFNKIDIFLNEVAESTRLFCFVYL